jgi:multicomponent Na+:H+ antiporter subunit D
VSPEATLVAALAAPLAAAGAAPLLGRWPDVREAASLVAGGTSLAAVASLVPRVAAGERPRLQLFDVLPDLSLAFEVEPLGLLFALVASGLWIVTTCYSIGYLRGHGEGHQSRFFACFALAIAAALGVALASNLFTLFLFYELLTLSTYPLVAHHGDERARRGARVYLGLLLSTSIGLLLLAIVWTWNLAGTLDFRPGGILAGKAEPATLGILLALYAFGTGKAALMPLHGWLPAAMVAPTPVSALLHAVAVVKAGVFTILKVVVYVFGVEQLRGSAWSQWLPWVAGATILIASLVAWTRDNLKARLAYSTVSQLAYIVLGAALANSWSVVGGGMHIATHALGKITLFFCAGAIYVATDKTRVSQMQGIGRAMPVTTAAFLIGSLSVIGLPPLGGSWSKWYLALGAAEAHQAALLGVLMISSLLNIAYLLPIPVRGFFRPPPETEPAGVREAPLLCLVPLCLTAAGCVALFFLVDPLYRLLAPIARP